MIPFVMTPGFPDTDHRNLNGNGSYRLPAQLRSSKSYWSTWGSFVYLETIRDPVLRGDAGAEDCMAAALVHEFGHQFGIDDDTGGIMGPGGCLRAPHYFTDSQLAQMRTKGAPR